MILPLKLRGVISYSVPESIVGKVRVGSWVVVTLRGKRYLSVVERLGDLEQNIDPAVVHSVEEVVESLPAVSASEMNFWSTLAEYYMCSVGEVFKSAYPLSFFRQVEKLRSVKRRQKEYAAATSAAVLSPVQSNALFEIRNSFNSNRNVLLHGVTGSGKTEIYIKLALDALESGSNVLYLVPEIALSKQLEERLGAVFGRHLLVWHSQQTPAARKAVFDRIKVDNEPFILLGTRSAVLLPFDRLSLIIVDEEHDTSYKQDDPAPRYNGRDVALMIASRLGAHALLGSATPSLESLYNARNSKLDLVELPEKYFNAPEAEISLIDMRTACRLKDTRGPFSMKLVNMIDSVLRDGKQVLIFRSRRSYASFVQCSVCGDVPKCPNCNVSLSYHRFSNTLECHYCGYKHKYFEGCKACGKGSLVLRGAGTERLEEELKVLFPEARVARMDSDIATSKCVGEQVLKEFAEGGVDILVGTQMISKGFDFPNLALVAVINADSMLSLQDFRADERALQLLHQLSGRAGRRGNSGRLVIQTFQPEHDVFRRLAKEDRFDLSPYMEERKVFGFPPYVRLVEVSVRDVDVVRLDAVCEELASKLHQLGITDFFGPVAPQVDRVRGKRIAVFWVKLPRTAKARQLKRNLACAVEDLRIAHRTSTEIVLDVDPV